MKKFTLLITILIIAITNGQSQNLALSKTATASSENPVTNNAGNAVDGNGGSRWESAQADPQWISIDLGQSYSIGQVILNWEGAFGSAYTIDVSEDESTWTTIYTETTGDGGVDNLTVTGTGRYVRMYGTARGTIWGYSLWEFEIYEAVAIETVATLSDLQVDGETIDGFSAGTLDYTYGLVGGAAIPTVTATATNDGNAGVVITAATSVPGTTTIVVTSEDASVTNTFNIAFAYTSPAVGVPTPPARAEVDVISIFSNAYTDVAGTDFLPFWGQSTDVTTENIGSDVLKYADFDFQGTNLGSVQNASGMEYLHVDMWTADATVVQVTPINNSGAPAEFLVNIDPIVAGSWQSYDIQLSDFTDGGMGLDGVFQLKFDGRAGVSPSNVYLDNIYFWKEPTSNEEDATLSDLLIDGSTIANFNSGTLDYTYDLVGGAAIPTVTATATNDGNAGVVITETTIVPGTTTIVVTSEDASATNTYNVTFAYTSPAAGAPTPPVRESDDVISVYSSAYTDVPVTTYDAGWSSSDFSEESIDGNQTIKLANLNYHGMEIAPDINVSAMEYLHIDMWTADAPAVNAFCISRSSGERFESLTINEGTWESYDIPMSEYTDQGLTISDLFQFKFDGAAGATIYLDNIYFWKEPTVPGSDADLSDLTLDGTTIDDFSANTLLYSVTLDEGATIPTIGATANDDGNATLVITQANAPLPATATVVVTSQNGLETNTYEVEFSLPPASEYCETEVTHFNIPAEVASAINLTITNLDATSMYVEIESADADAVDLLEVQLVTDNPTISDVIVTAPGKMRRTLTWATPPTNVSIQLVWSKESTPGNWMLNPFSVPFAAKCVVIPIEEIATLSDLQIDGTTIEGFDSETLDYAYGLASGAAIPTVTATATNDGNANIDITPAASIPGTTTIVVTSEDASATMTYNVDFFYSTPTTAAPTPLVRVATDVISVFSSAYSNITVDTLDASWSNSDYSR